VLFVPFLDLLVGCHLLINAADVLIFMGDIRRNTFHLSYVQSISQQSYSELISAALTRFEPLDQIIQGYIGYGILVSDRKRP
jgi:hypothetical protein